MERSSEINELAKALSLAQSVIHGAKKDSKNPFFNSKYADLESVWDAARGPLTENGLSVSQHVDGEALVSILMHSSGQYLMSSYPLIPKDKSPQAIGSCVSYSRRYALAAIVGITQVDDDAEAAQPRGEDVKPLKNHAPQTQKEAAAIPSKFATRDVVASLYAIGRAKKYADDEIKKVILNTSGAKSMSEVPTMAVGVIKAYLESNEPGVLK